MSQLARTTHFNNYIHAVKQNKALKPTHRTGSGVNLIIENEDEQKEKHHVLQSQSLKFDGFLEFNLPNVFHPSFGSKNVKSRIPRIQPKLERPPVSQKEIETLTNNLMEWICLHFEVKGKEEYFHVLATSSTLFTVYVNPIPSLDSKEMDLAIKIYFWLWFTDDEIETAIEEKIPFKMLKQGTDQLARILDGDFDQEQIKFMDVPDYQFFKPLFTSWLDLHRMCDDTVADYRKRVGPMKFYLQRYFEAQRWYCVDRIDERYSEQTFRAWRRIVAYFDGIVEVVALIHGVTLPPQISCSPTMLRILEICNSFGGFVNDLVGMKKEFQNGQRDNIIVFKVLSKNMGLEEAVAEICNLLKSELTDYILMKRVILLEFSNDPILVRYLDMLDSLIDGHNRIYQQSARHYSAGCVTLTR